VRGISDERARRPKPVIAGPGDPALGAAPPGRILIALAQHPEGPADRQIGAFAGVSIRGGTFRNWLSNLRTSGWLVDEVNGKRRITDDGLKALGSYEPLPTGADLRAYWQRELGAGATSKIFQVIADAYPSTLTLPEVASAPR
jgi:hypothetical protein